MTIRVILAVLLAVFGYSCSRQGQAKVAPAGEKAAVVGIRAAAAEARTLGRSISVTGSLLPDETVNVSSEVPGRIAAIHADFGQRVRKGEVLVEIDRQEYQIQVDRGRAALAQALARIGLNPNQEEVTPEQTPAIRQAQAAYEDAKFKYENAARLIKSGDIAQERFIEVEKAFHARDAALQAARDDLRTQLASVQAIRAELRLAEKRLGDTYVRAPFDGAVSARLLSPGQYMKDNTTVLTLVKTSPLRLRVDIPETASAEVRMGSLLAFTTDAVPGREFHATVRELNPALESRSRSLTAEARLNESDEHLRPGMFVQVRLDVARDATAVMVPKEALYQIAGLTKLFLVRNGRVVENKITAGAEAGGWVEVPADTVRPGDLVATTKLGMLIDGAEVRVENR